MPKRRVQRGQGIKDVLSKVNNFLKKTQIISKAAGGLASMGVAPSVTGGVATAARALGYGKKKRMQKGRGGVTTIRV